MPPPPPKHALVALNFYFQNCLLPFLAWANSMGRHWSHILTYSQQQITPPTPPQVEMIFERLKFVLRQISCKTVAFYDLCKSM